MLNLAILVCLCFTALADHHFEDDEGHEVYWGYVQTDTHFDHYPIALPTKMAVYCNDLTWEESFSTANGKGYCDLQRQSPININTGDCVNSDTSLGSFTFNGYDEATTTLSAHNNGHGIGLSPEDATAAINQTISGGGLPKEYRFAQFHIHWGPDDCSGSEHTMDGVSAPMELHIVHYDASFADIGASLGAPSANGDNLAVLGVMYEIDDSAADIPYLTQMLTAGSATGGVSEYVTDNKITYGTVTLGDMLPDNTDDFYRYEGSLTTPTCNEEVQWTVFKTPVKVNSAQMAAIRAAYEFSSGMTMRINYRPTQPLNGRLVTASFGSSMADAEMCASMDVGAASSLKISALLLAAVSLLAVLFH